MIRNYFKLFFRSLQRNSVYSFINIAGLSVGLACSMLIMLWVFDEYNFDSFNKNYNSLYRVLMNYDYEGTVETNEGLPYPLKKVLDEQIPEIKNSAYVSWGEEYLFEYKNNNIVRQGLHVSPKFLEMFTYDFIEGDIITALNDANNVLISESLAEDLFGGEKVLGKYIKLNNDKDFVVTGILKNVPQHSTFQFDFLIPWSNYERQEWLKDTEEDWNDNSFRIFVELHKDASIVQANEKANPLVRKNLLEDPSNKQVWFYPISGWRLYSEFKNGVAEGGRIEYVRLFTIIAFFVLIIACINFMNLATARSEKRAREVGIRKSLGSGKMGLIFQFLSESVLMTLISFLLGLTIIQLSLNTFNELIGKELTMPYTSGVFWAISILFILTIGLFSGSYPAFFLSSFRPVEVLKGRLKIGKGEIAPRKVLVTLQFSFSILLIIGTVVVYQQIQHVKQREVGYEKDGLIMVSTTSEIESQFQTVRNELEATGVVKSITKSNSPVTDVYSVNDVRWKGLEEGRVVEFVTVATEYDYAKTMGVEVIKGRDFSPDFEAERKKVIINKRASEIIALEDPIGEMVFFFGEWREIIGVIDNMVMGSPYDQVDPMMITFYPDWSGTISIRLNETKDMEASLSKIEKVMLKHNPGYPFEYQFIDEEFDKKYTSISLIGKLANLFAFLAILITGLGIFGLAAFTAEQRTKEVGVRKVLGASVTNIMLLISKDFARLVVFAFVIAGPLSWWALDNFLSQYSYRIDLAWWVIPAAGMFALILAVFIVSTQALKAASVNPVKSLKNG
ncbi:MAG: ABC transporter permease [Bacteroidota bacterium]